jgi:hypothetical protein
VPLSPIEKWNTVEQIPIPVVELDFVSVFEQNITIRKIRDVVSPTPSQLKSFSKKP